MQTIKRDIYVMKNVLQAPIEVTEGTNSIAIEFDVRDYDIPASAAAVVYSLSTSSMEEPNKALADVSGNKITIIPSEAFFLPGQNVMQIRIIDGNSKLISFNIIVKCTGKMRFGDEDEEGQSTLIEQILAKLGEYTGKIDVERKRIDKLDSTKANKTDLTSPYNFKGSCLSSALPASGNTVNDTYYCTDLKYRKTWNGSAWEQSSLNEADYEDELIKTNGEVSSLKEDIRNSINFESLLYESTNNSIKVFQKAYDDTIKIDKGPSANYEVRVYGRNILDNNNLNRIDGYNYNYATLDSNGHIIFNNISNPQLRVTTIIPCYLTQGQTYILSKTVYSNTDALLAVNVNASKNVPTGIKTFAFDVPLTWDKESGIYWLRPYTSKESTITECNLQLEIGDTVHAYEKYSGKIYNGMNSELPIIIDCVGTFSVNNIYNNIIYYGIADKNEAILENNRERNFKNTKPYVFTDAYNNTSPTITNLSNISNISVNIVGDSMVATGNLGQYIKTKLSCDVHEYGCGGTTIAVHNTTANEPNRSFVERIKNIGAAVNVTTDADIWVIWGGYNDLSPECNVPIGTLDSIDNTTVYGALKEISEYILKKNNSPRIIFVTPHRSNGRIINSGKGKAYRELRECFYTIADIYGCKVVDLWNCGINQKNCSVFTSDGLHLNEHGKNIVYPLIKNAISDMF